jgi:hypothetical protein
LIGVCGLTDNAVGEFEVAVRRIDWIPTAPGLGTSHRKVPLSVGLRIERLGLRSFAAGGWAGSRGRQLRVQELALRPIDLTITLEVRAYGAENRRTEWTPSREFAGFGDEIPLTGFAARLTAPLNETFAIFYSGAFAKGGVIGPFQDGQPCQSYIEGDPLVAVDAWIRET